VRQFITAGEAGEQVPDRSVFKTVFLQGIKGDADLNRDGFVTGSELGMHLQERVVNYSRGGQHPQYGKINNPKLDRGDFIFALKRPQETKPPQTIAPPPARLLRLSFGANGTVVHIGAREGDSVEKGQEIARLDPAIHKVLHEQAKAEFLKGRAEARQAELAYTRTKELHRRQVASTSSLEEAHARQEKAAAALKSLEAKLELARLRLRGTRLTAPVAGRIEKLDIEVGERAQEGRIVVLLAPF
jgi:biotin carboxyl carrier protein